MFENFKNAEKLHVLLDSEKSNWYFTKRQMYI